MLVRAYGGAADHKRDAVAGAARGARHTNRGVLVVLHCFI